MDKLALKPQEAAKALGLSRTATYAALRSGELPSCRIGRRILVPVSALDALLADCRSPSSGSGVEGD
jgi:excisionase family DNA binding protein